MNLQRCKHPRIWLLPILLTLLCLDYVDGSLAQDRFGDTLPEEIYVGAAFVPGELLIGYYADQAGAASLRADLGIQVVETLDLRGPDSRTGDAGLIGYRLSVPPGEEWSILEILQRDPAVAFVHPNWLVYSADVAEGSAMAQPEDVFPVNDPSYVDQQWHLPRINASRAWALAYDAGGFNADFTPIHVAVVDSGIDTGHPDLQGVLLEGHNYVPDSAAMMDDCGHGTHVAGLIGAVTNNSTGVAGLAPAVQIDARRVLRASGGVCTGTLSNVSQAIRDAADAGADIINLSLEVYLPPSSLTVLEAAVNYAASNGALLVAAAGNRGASEGVAYPAAFDTVMAIAATTYEEMRASYSGTGPQVELAAPGGVTARSIFSTWSRTAKCRDSGTESAYCTSEGTSMAAAIASGGAALVWSLDPELSASQVRQILRETAAPVAGTPLEVGSGRLDVHAALRRILPGDIQLSNEIIEYRTKTRAPTTMTVRIENPGLDPIAWEADIDDAVDWVEIAGKAAGTSSYSAPDHLFLAFDPSGLPQGLHTTPLRFTGTRPDGSQVVKEAPLRTVVNAFPNQWHQPLILVDAPGRPTIATPYYWETPATPDDRQGIGMTDESTVAITLPFTLTLHGLKYATAQISANGYVSFPGNTSLPQGTTNDCLPNRDALGQAVYGWWADLNPGADNAQVSTFQPASNRFVIEFANVPTGPSVSAPYTVSFQIVLHQNGFVGLNYAQLPEQQNQPPDVTVGVETRDGLFYNQVACKDATTELGYPPVAPQSILIDTTGGVY